MILVDASIWIDHIRSPSEKLGTLLMLGHVAQHAFVTAEVALGSLASRAAVVEELRALPKAAEVAEAEFLNFIDRHELYGKGIGMVDAHLLASATKMAGARVWTRDKRLLAQAERLGLVYMP